MQRRAGRCKCDGYRQAAGLQCVRPVGVTRFTLTSDRQYEDDVDFQYIPIEGQIAAGTTTNDKFSFAICYRTTDERVQFQNIQGSNDFAKALDRILDLKGRQVIEDAIKVLGNFRGKFDSGHVSGLAYGLKEIW